MKRGTLPPLPIVIARRGEPLWAQVAGQLARAIQSGDVENGGALPSSRALAHALGVSRNTVLTAYDELQARGLVHGRRGAGMQVAAGRLPARRLTHLLREAHVTQRVLSICDPDGNPLTVGA